MPRIEDRHEVESSVLIEVAGRDRVWLRADRESRSGQEGTIARRLERAERMWPRAVERVCGLVGPAGGERGRRGRSIGEEVVERIDRVTEVEQAIVVGVESAATADDFAAEECAERRDCIADLDDSVARRVSAHERPLSDCRCRQTEDGAP